MEEKNVNFQNPVKADAFEDSRDETSALVKEEPDLSYLHPLCNPKKAIHRFIFLIFLSFLGYGSYFVYDNPAALESHFLQDSNLSISQYTFLYSVYSYPNMILCFFGGFLVDRVFGLRWGAVIFSVFILVGQIIFALGIYLNIFYLALFGRLVFGLGGECLIVTQNLYAVTWFIGKELNMVLGLQISFSRVGSTTNLYVMNPIYNLIHDLTGSTGYHLLGSALFVATTTCLMSFLCSVVCYIMDKRKSKLLKQDESKTGEVIKLSDIKTFPLTFWIISILCVTYYVAVFPFISLGPVYFERKWDYNAQMASFVAGLPYIVSAVACPFVGYAIDRTGKNVMWVLSSVIITLGAHALIAFTFFNPFVGTTILGIGYSVLACSLWPLVAYVIPPNQLGTAYGTMQSIQNTGLAFIPTAAGFIIENKGFLQTELLYIGMLALTLFVVVFLYFSDANKGSLLNQTSTQRSLLEAKKD